MGVFCKQLEQAILANECDFGVHSMKDLPTTLTKGLTVVAIPPLKDWQDVVIFNWSRHPEVKSLKELPEGSIIGSSSLWRIYTLKHLYGEKFKIDNIRGNLNTWLKKLDESYDAIVLARAGVVWLGWEDKIGEILDLNEFGYAPAQGSLAVQCRTDDEQLVSLLGTIDDPLSRHIVTAERILLSVLEGGCTLPISVNTEVSIGEIEET